MKRTIALILFFFGYQLLFQALAVGLWALVQMAGGVSVSELAGTSPAMEYILVGQAVATLAIGLHVWWAGDVSRESRTWSAVSAGTLLCCVLLMLGMGAWTNLLTELLRLPDYNAGVVREMMSRPVGVVSIVLLAPVAEELLFRGAVQRHLAAVWHHPAGAVCASALIFGLVHANPAQMPFAALMGLVLGWVYHRTGSLLLCIVMHMVNNGSSVLLYHLSGASAETVTMVEELGEVGAYATAAVGLLLAVGCVGWLNGRCKNT